MIVNWPLAAMAALNLALVIVPTLLMGATLPILVAHLVRRSGQVGGAVGLLYYVNTLGAGAACLVCAIVLFPFFGMHSAIYTAAAMNLAVAVAVSRAVRRAVRRSGGNAVVTALFLQHRGIGGGRHHHRVCADGLSQSGANRAGAWPGRHGLRADPDRRAACGACRMAAACGVGRRRAVDRRHRGSADVR